MKLQEHGFWDYTTPGCGGMEHYRKQDCLDLLDDMAGAGMNSLAIVIKWMTTGYRSQLDFLDQEPTNPVIASDNDLLHFVLEEARRRRIKVWLGAVVTQFVVERYGPSAHRHFEVFVDGRPRQTAVYDLDRPGLIEHAIALFSEIVTLFPQADGLMVELEGGDVYAPHRAAPYNQWAGEHDRSPVCDGNVPGGADYGRYAAYRRGKTLRAIEQAVRARGFAGDLSTICEVLNTEYQTAQVVDLRELARHSPDTAVITYDYDRWRRRLAVADYCLRQPREYGFRTFYLGRGVMTWNRHWKSPQPPLPAPLQQSWTMDVEDVARYQPDGMWWFGSGAVREGAHVDPSELTKMGFKDGRDARQQLLGVVAASP